MLRISEQNRDEIVKAIVNSVIPTNMGIQIINVLNGLQKIEEIESKKEKNA